MRPNRQRAMTLIEMVVVVVILAVIATSAVISLGTLSSTRVEAETRRFITDLNWIRHRAVGTNTWQAVYLEDDDNFYDLYESPSPTLSLLERVELESTLRLVDANVSLYIYFKPDGSTNLTDSSETIKVQKGTSGPSRDITVFRDTGHVKME